MEVKSMVDSILNGKSIREALSEEDTSELNSLSFDLKQMILDQINSDVYPVVDVEVEKFNLTPDGVCEFSVLFTTEPQPEGSVALVHGAVSVTSDKIADKEAWESELSVASKFWHKEIYY